MRVRARMRYTPGVMNKTEQRRAEELELLKRAGEVQWFAFEPVRFRLAYNTTYTPDFLVLSKDGGLMAEEIKGSWVTDDSRVKVKVFAETFKWIHVRVFVWQKKGGWKIEEIPA